MAGAFELRVTIGVVVFILRSDDLCSINELIVPTPVCWVLYAQKEHFRVWMYWFYLPNPFHHLTGDPAENSCMMGNEVMPIVDSFNLKDQSFHCYAKLLSLF